MGMPPLNYAEPVRLDPLPALRRIRALAITWSTLVILYEITGLFSEVFWPDGGGWSVYVEQPLWVRANALSAVLSAGAVLVWRPIDPLRARGLRPWWRAGVLMLLVVSIGRIASYQLTRTWLDGVAFASEFARFGHIHGARCRWAAIQPTGSSPPFDWREWPPSRNGRLPASQVWRQPIRPGRGLLATLLSRGWIVLVIPNRLLHLRQQFSSAATRELRRGRSAITAVVASWLILAMIGWSAFVYGLWWNSIQLARLNAVRIAGVGAVALQRWTGVCTSGAT